MKPHPPRLALLLLSLLLTVETIGLVGCLTNRSDQQMVQELANQLGSPVPGLALLGGLALGLLLSRWINPMLETDSEITEQRQTKAALRQSEATTSQILKAIPDLILWMTADGTYLNLIEGKTVINAHDLPSAVGQNIQDMLPSDIAELRMDAIHRALETNEMQIYEQQLIIEGETRHEEVRVVSGEADRILVIVRDITDRKRAEAALRQSEATRNQILSAIPDLILWLSADGTYIDLFEGNSILNVHQSLNAIGQTIYDMLPPDIAKLRMDAIHRALETNEMQIYEQQLVIKGETRHEEVRVLSVAEDRVLVIVRDITDRKQAEAALQAQRAFLHQVIDVLPNPLFVKDQEGRFITINRAGAEIFGLEIEQIIGKQEIEFNPYLSQVQFEQYLANNREVMHSRQMSQNSPEQLTLATGERRWYQMRLSPFVDADGIPQGIVGNATDITELKQAEAALLTQNQALRESEERFRRAFQDAPIGMALIDLENQWLRVNPRLCDMLECSETALLSTPALALVHPDDQAKIQSCIDQVLTSDSRSAQVELRYCCHTDRLVWGLVNLSLVRDSQNQPLYYVAQIQDVTERRAIERIKNEFISVVSHELRTPLTAIRGFLGLLNTGMYNNRPDRAKRLIEQATINSDRLVHLVNDILDLERLDSGRAPLVMQVCDAAELMQQAVAGIQSIADQAQIRLMVEPTNLRVWAAPDSIIQMLTNLLSNAIKFSPADSVIQLAAQMQLDTVLFQVQDQGRGIPPDKLQAVFERFQQVDLSDSRQKGGTGLGLAICQSIIQQHEGNIWVESTLGVGSTFYFTLPIPPR